MKPPRLLFPIALACLPHQPAAAAVVVTTPPPTEYLEYLSVTGADIAGGTFRMEGPVLQSVTLSLGGTGGYRPVLLATDGLGQPTGAPLWIGDEFAAPGADGPVTFTPEAVLGTGELVFFGIDTGVLGSVGTGGAVRIGIVEPDPALPDGQWWESVNGLPFTSFQNDLSATITTVPEPAATSLVLAALALCLARTTRRRES